MIFVRTASAIARPHGPLHLREKPGDRGRRECPVTSGDDGRKCTCSQIPKHVPGEGCGVPGH